MKIIKFTPEIILCDPWAADIIAENNWDIICKSSFGTVNDSLKNNISVILFDFGCVGDGAVEECLRQSR